MMEFHCYERRSHVCRSKFTGVLFYPKKFRLKYRLFDPRVAAGCFNSVALAFCRAGPQSRSGEKPFRRMNREGQRVAPATDKNFKNPKNRTPLWKPCMPRVSLDDRLSGVSSGNNPRATFRKLFRRWNRGGD